jgi:DNA topoisomerase I
MARRGGWRRLGRRRFRYVDSRGRPVQAEAQLERIRALAIPPAWQDVWISPNPSADLQATGVDSAGRRQYLYSERHEELRSREKFDRLLHFARGLPTLRARAESDLRRGPYEPEWACAIAIGVVNKAWFRVGTDRHARASRTYGVTTLRKRHVDVEGDEIRFVFRTKNRALVRRTLRSAPLARELAHLLALDGSRLFRFEREGELVNLTATVLNEYIAARLGNGFTAKDFRTWGGTELAAPELVHAEPARSQAEAKRSIARGIERVAAQLGNTTTVCKRYYVHTAVLEAYASGRLHAEGRGGGARRREARHSAEQLVMRLLASARDPRRSGRRVPLRLVARRLSISIKPRSRAARRATLAR